MDLFSDFCNICYKTNDGNLKNISGENMKNLKDILLTFVGHADIINDNIINLCQLCCEVLKRSNKFREMCFTNLIQLRQRVFDMKSKLQLEDETYAVQNTLQIFVQQEVLNTHEKSNRLVSIPTKYEFVKRSTGLSKKGEDLNRQIINLQSESNECAFAADNSDISVIKNNTGECQESPVAFTFMKCEIECNEDSELKKEKFYVKKEAERVSKDFALRNRSKSGGHVNLDDKMPAVNNSEGIVNDGTEYLEDQEQNSTSEGLELGTTEAEFGDGLNVPFEISNICTIVKKKDCEPKTITIEKKSKDYMKLPSTTCNKKSTAVIMNTQPSRPHMREQHSGRYPTALQPDVHKLLYQDAEPYTCTRCSKSFRTSRCLTTHQRTHNGNRHYKCTVCNKAFTSSSNLIKHERIHSGDRPFKCTDCNKAFKQLVHLITHKRIHSGDRPYKCRVCNKTFAESSTLTKHERTHNGDRPYKCTVCTKAFTQSSYLVVHERTHSGYRPYKCNVCNKTYTGSSALNKHKRSHIGDTPYECTVCRKKFVQLFKLATHARVHNVQ